MICQGGLVFAADTRVVFADDSVSDMQKLLSFRANAGMFAIAQSAEDANAADSLIRNLEYTFRDQDPETCTFAILEAAIETQLQSWYVPVYDNRPRVQLLIGICLNGNEDRRIYFCEPPNTVTRVLGGYQAIGDGWLVSDPIYNHWFKQEMPSSPHACLCQISYLMYKAKQVKPTAVGGHTDAVLITGESGDFDFPYYIERVSMAVAESHGMALDRHLNKLAGLVMAGSLEGQKDILQAAESIYSSSMSYAALEFRCQFPEKTIRRKFCT
jgi:hypothetical protein